tara:strand:- start:19 stop:1074 length:1056 start_codon:yes stop_codon:yes gene_type:complete
VLQNKRRLVSKWKKKKERREVSGYYLGKGRRALKKLGRHTYELTLPEVFSFERNHNSTVSELATLRRYAETRGIRFFVNFREITELESVASLALASEVHRWSQQVSQPLTTPARLWNGDVKRAFYQMGLFELLEIGNTTPTTGDRTYVKFIFGDSANGDSARRIRTALEEVSNSKIDKKIAYEGITEAMNNVLHHAYPETSRNEEIFSVSKPWWLGGSYLQSEDRLAITFCDHGVGIPYTLPRKYGIEKVRAFFSAVTNPDDAQMIEAAFEMGRTETLLSHHGKGLQEIRNFVDNYPTASLRVLSSRGEYLYLRKDGRVSVKKRTHPNAYKGTIIEWQIPRIHEPVEDNGT